MGYDTVDYLSLYIDRMDVILTVFRKAQKNIENTMVEKKDKNTM